MGIGDWELGVRGLQHIMPLRSEHAICKGGVCCGQEQKGKSGPGKDSRGWQRRQKAADHGGNRRQYEMIMQNSKSRIYESGEFFLLTFFNSLCAVKRTGALILAPGSCILLTIQYPSPLPPRRSSETWGSLCIPSIPSVTGFPSGRSGIRILRRTPAGRSGQTTWVF